MAKDLGYNDKKIASTLGLQLIYFAHIVSMIPELSDALEKAREELINEEKHGHNGRLGRKIVSVTVTAIPDINPDLL